MRLICVLFVVFGCAISSHELWSRGSTTLGTGTVVPFRSSQIFRLPGVKRRLFYPNNQVTGTVKLQTRSSVS